MRAAIFDCFSGISGDMTVGAFLDLGLELPVLKKNLSKLGLGGYEISARKVSRRGMRGTKFEVKIKKHSHSMAYRNIKKIINGSRLDGGVKKMSLSIFEKLAEAEARVHGMDKQRVHFHEIGDLDSIIDIVSAAVAVKELGLEKFYCLNLSIGKGNIASRHGTLPLPAPAVTELLAGKPVLIKDVDYELVTPTGAAILSALVEDFTRRPSNIRIDKTGYGAGSFDPESGPNLLRVILADIQGPGLEEDSIVVLETNIDDMNPVYWEYVIERLLKKGALDAFLTPVYMKKTRPGVLLTVLAEENKLEELSALVMRETTSSGVRYYKADRKKLRRVIKTVRTKYGPIRIKINSGPYGIETASPEYEDCRRAAVKFGVPFKFVFEEARDKTRQVRR